jgi:hypothetical protein
MGGISKFMTGANLLGSITGQSVPAGQSAPMQGGGVTNASSVPAMGVNAFTQNGDSENAADGVAKTVESQPASPVAQANAGGTNLVAQNGGDATGGMLKSLVNNPGLFIGAGNLLQGYGSGKSAAIADARQREFARVPKNQSVYGNKQA